MTRLEVWSARLLYVTLSITTWLSLWLLGGSTFSDAAAFGAFVFILGILTFEMYKSAVVDARLRLSPEEIIRIRIAELEENIAEAEKNTEKYREKLRLLQDDPRFCFDVENNSKTEKQFMDMLQKLDHELKPKLKRRAKLHAELDELIQKKGYRGQS